MVPKKTRNNMSEAKGDNPTLKSKSTLIDELKVRVLTLCQIHRYLPSLFYPLYQSLAFNGRSTKSRNTTYTLSISLYIRDTSVSYGVIPSWAEDLKKEYASKMAKAKQKRDWLFHPNWKTIEECKIQGEFLEKVTAGILQEKGYTVLPHNVEDRFTVDVIVIDTSTGTFVARDNWTMENSNVSETTTYPYKRLKTHLDNFKFHKKRGYDGFWLISHKGALKNVQKDLDKLGVEVLEIGKVVLPENLYETYHLVKKAIDSKIPNALQKRERR